MAPPTLTALKGADSFKRQNPKSDRFKVREREKRER